MSIYFLLEILKSFRTNLLVNKMGNDLHIFLFQGKSRGRKEIAVFPGV